MSEAVAASGVFEGGHMERNIAGRAFKRAELPEDLVGAVSFLSSAASDFMTGQVMVVDGGVGGALGVGYLRRHVETYTRRL